MKKIYLYLLETMADWESGYFLQALTLQKMLPKQTYQFNTVAAAKQPIKTAAGITVFPDLSLDEVNMDEIGALVLIGADTWMEKEQRSILDLAAKLMEKNVLVAAICGATLGLADAGLLDLRFHTSNALFFLTGMAPNYKGTAKYKEEAAVADRNLITAGSAGSLLWARYILEQLKIYPPETIEAWYQYFATGDAKYFGELMRTFQR